LGLGAARGSPSFCRWCRALATTLFRLVKTLSSLYCKAWMENSDYQTAVRLALKSSTKLQRDIAFAFLEEPHQFLHKELVARFGIAPITLNGDFGKLGHRVYEILQWHPEGWQLADFQWCTVLVHLEESAGQNL
jgi:hypothetical protein